jgi:muramoyltetrapeptide carboxypeptidase
MSVRFKRNSFSLFHIAGKLSFALGMQSLKLPPRLRAGDKVALVAPAKKLTEEVLSGAKNLLEKEGFEVWVGPNALNEHGGFAGSDVQRASDLQQALDDDSTKAIICLRGGYGSIRTLPLLDFTKFRRKPKWIAGYSDITLFHALLNNVFGMCSIHSTMPLDYSQNSVESLETLILALRGKELDYHLPSSEFSRPGITSGQLTGGNLSLLHNLQGTELDFESKQKILFLEDISESYYAIDRMIQSMKLAGKFDGLAGLIVGSMTKVNDNGDWFRGQDIREVILEALKDFRFPIAFDFPAGHQADNRALMMGRMVNLVVGDETSLTFY